MEQTLQQPAVIESKPAAAAPPKPKAARLASLDTYRGATMLLLATSGFGFTQVAKNFKDDRFWQFLSWHTDHAPWLGCALWDLIQPSFMFMVGVSLPYSIAARAAKGDSFGRQFAHAVQRSLILIFLGIFLRSLYSPQTNFTFDDVLTQIGLGYTFLFLLGVTSVRTQLVAAGAILFADWLAFALYPLPPAGFNYTSVGVPADWPHLSGFAAHWDKNTNLAAAFDGWWMNLFPRSKPFEFSPGGYHTLNFVPALATMIFGSVAGHILKRSGDGYDKLRTLIYAGLGGIAIGWALEAAGICPSVKRIWTPSWALFAGGITFLILAGFYWAVDLKGWQRPAFIFIVVGSNSIMIYCMNWLWRGFTQNAYKRHFGNGIFTVCGTAYEPILSNLAVALTFWLILYWMYRNKYFVKI